MIFLHSKYLMEVEEMFSVSCDICKSGIPHDYVPNHYYCGKDLFFNDKEPRTACEKGEIDDSAYKRKYGTSYTMMQFKETVSKINELRKNEKLILESFQKSTCELSEVFHYILNAELEGRKQTCLTVQTCPELYAKELEGMGFEIEEDRNAFNTVCGYYIQWK